MTAGVARVPPELAFVLVKAFGDLTITASVLRRLPVDRRADCSLLIAPHLADLCRVLAPACRVEVLDIDGTLPPLFDLKRFSLRATGASALQLRRVLARAAPGATLVLDRLSWRERFITSGRAALPLGEHLSENVYAAHAAFLERTLSGVELTPQAERLVPATNDRRVGLFPFSRVAAKNVPVDIVARVARQCRDQGAQPVVMLLEGEEFPTLADTPCTRIPRRFDALAGAIETVGAVISADSLPAHLAEYFGHPAFVVAPVPNPYYMPPTTFSSHHWGVFGEPAELDAELGRFLSTLP